MRASLLEILVCPKCKGGLSAVVEKECSDGQILEGSLSCTSCQACYPISAGIPRFVDPSNYATSFGLQWNTFHKTQLDTFNGTSLSKLRFFRETSWTPDWLSGKWILDAGCGAGRFLDIATQYSGQVVGVDVSNSVDAVSSVLQDRNNLHLVQASIFDLPFRQQVFDGCYCIGVIQHTPDPLRAMRSLPPVLKKNGRLATTIYERRKWTLWHGKYIARHLTRHIERKSLLRLIQATMPFWFVVTEVSFRIPFARRLAQFALPIANYVDEPQLNLHQRYEWAILDTFDMLSPVYDSPQTEEAVITALSESGLRDIERLANSGLNLIGVYR